MSGLFRSFKAGSKWLGREVLPIFGAASGSAALAAASVLAKEKLTPKAEPPAPAEMPDEDALLRASRRALAARLGQTGRASTILSDRSDEPLG